VTHCAAAPRQQLRLRQIELVGAERPAKFVFEKIVTWHAALAANTGDGGSGAAAAGGKPTRGQDCTHCGSAPPSSKSTIRQCNWQPSGVNPCKLAVN
jgi:hypothetical protein